MPIPYLRNNDVVDRSNIFSSIERLAGEEPSSQDVIQVSIKAHLFDSNSRELDRCVIETFGYILAYEHEHLTRVFFAAGAYEKAREVYRIRESQQACKECLCFFSALDYLALSRQVN